eukprot:6202351-Pleurochrysis_carterae.AAC.1
MFRLRPDLAPLALALELRISVHFCRILSALQREEHHGAFVEPYGHLIAGGGEADGVGLRRRLGVGLDVVGGRGEHDAWRRQLARPSSISNV